MDPEFFYETVAPLLLVGVTSLICISTLTSDINFYTRLFKMKDAVTGLPIFSQLQVVLACHLCREKGIAAQCKHMLHLVPQWQSSVRHERLKTVMADRPDLIQSELSVRSCFAAVTSRVCVLVLLLTEFDNVTQSLSHREWVAGTGVRRAAAVLPVGRH